MALLEGLFDSLPEIGQLKRIHNKIYFQIESQMSMINYFPIQLFYVGSSLMSLLTLLRCEFSPFYLCLIIHTALSFLGALLVKRYMKITVFLHKLSTIALITTSPTQTSYTEIGVFIVYIVAETNPLLLLLTQQTLYLNVQFILTIYGAIIIIVNKSDFNDQMLVMLVVSTYVLANFPALLKRKQQLQEPSHYLPQEPPDLSPSNDYLPVQEKVSSYRGQNHKKSINSWDINQPQRQSELLSIEIVGQNQNQDKIWKQRLRGIPVGIILINKTNKQITYQNTCFENLFINTLKVENNIHEVFLEQLKFKIINQGAELYQKSNYSRYFSLNRSRGQIDLPKTYTQQSFHTNPRKKKDSANEIETHHVNRVYTFIEVMQKLIDGQFDNQLNDSDHTLELYCKQSVKDSVAAKVVHLNTKVLFSPDTQEMQVVIQDYTRQNKLQRIEEQDEFKTKMISSFSHELRTPLNSASLFFKSALLDQNLHPEVKSKYIKPGLSSLMRQSHLINDIIDFSQINAEVLELRFSTFPLRDLLLELTELFHYEYTAKKLGLAFQIESSVPETLKTDYQRLLQILINVIQNALKYSELGYTLIKISGNQQNVRFQVQDEGMGISQTKLNHIQIVLKDYHSQLQGWNGFGLIISQMLLRYLGPLYENDLKLDSPGLGLGTQVTFIVSNHIMELIQPLKYTRHRRSSQPDLNVFHGLHILIRSETSSKLILQQTSVRLSTISAFMSQKNTTPRLKQRLNNIYQQNWKSIMHTMKKIDNFKKCKCMTILSVDDEIFNQLSLTSILQKLNFTVEIAFNGQQAIHMIENKKECSQGCRKYLLVLMDCQMPVIDGWQATRILRSKFDEGLLHPIPIIGFTAFTSKADIDQCRQAGMVDILHKPLQVKKLRYLIDKLHLI